MQIMRSGTLTRAVAENLEIILEWVINVQWRRSPMGDLIMIPFSLPKLPRVNCRGAGMAQWWEHSPPTNVAWVQFWPDMWVGFVGSLLSTKRFSPGTPFSPLLKNHLLTRFVLFFNLSLQCPQFKCSSTRTTWHLNKVPFLSFHFPTVFLYLS